MKRLKVRTLEEQKRNGKYETPEHIKRLLKHFYAIGNEDALLEMNYTMEEVAQLIKEEGSEFDEFETV